MLLLLLLKSLYVDLTLFQRESYFLVKVCGNVFSMKSSRISKFSKIVSVRINLTFTFTFDAYTYANEYIFYNQNSNQHNNNYIDIVSIS